MSKFTRRGVLGAGAASGAAFAMQSTRSAAMQERTAPPQRRMLASKLSVEKIQAALLPPGKWKPYPAASDRTAWEALPVEFRREMIADGEAALKGSWPVLEASLLLQYVRIGNRSNYERVLAGRRERLRSLVLAECAEGKGRFLDEIANGVWTTCEESWWGYPAHLNLQKEGHGLPNAYDPSIDLFAAEAGALLAWTDYLLRPQLAKVHKMIPERLAIEVERRILTPYEKREDFWWMGLAANRPMNNWNPWINSNCLTCVLLMATDPHRRARLAYKVVTSVDRFLDSYHDDGGCDEGPGYFGHAGGSLFDNLELLFGASNGAIDFYSAPLVREIGRYIYKVNIADDWYVNFADASARVSIGGDLVYRYGKRIGDRNMQLLGAEAAQRHGLRGASLGRHLPALFNRKEIAAAPARQPLVRDVWLPGIQVMAARMKEGLRDGLYVAAQGGHNAESHNHNDVGNFIVYANGKPAIIDVGVETYTAKTFSSRRYEIWTMQSAYHNLPTVNGAMQFASAAAAARNVSHKVDDAAAEFSLDIAGAYPREAGIETWRRTIRLDRRKNEVEVRDAYVLQKDGGRVELTLMTPHEVKQTGSGELTFSGAVKVQFPPALTVAIEDVKTEDGRLKPVWGPVVRRVLLKAQGLPAKGEFAVRITQI
jgi:hypothetical protein